MTVGVGVGESVGVVLAEGDGVGVTITVGVGEAIGVGDGFVAGAATLFATPLFQTNFVPFLIHVKVLLFAVALEFSLVQGAPAEIFWAERAERGTKERAKVKTGATRTFFVKALKVLLRSLTLYSSCKSQ